MIYVLLAVYKWWPLRTHCRNGHHTTLCRLGDPILAVFQNDRRCGKPPRPHLP